MDDKERQRRIVEFIYSQPEVSDDLRQSFEQWMLEHEDDPETDRILNDLWCTHAVSDSPLNMQQGLERLHAAIRSCGMRRLKYRALRYAGMVAAAVLVFVGGYFTATNRTSAERVMLLTSEGHVGDFTLPDGTRVWLNEESRLEYLADFTGKTRDVTLTGEAFFQVTRDVQRPFRVGMNGLQVEVLGTSFDAISYADDRSQQVILKSGSVRICGDQFAESVMLTPDEKFSLNSDTKRYTVEPVDARNYCQWFESRLAFDNTPLADIIVNLERKYHVEITLSPRVPADKRLSLVVQHEPLEDIMEVIATLMPIRYQIDDNRVFVTNRIQHPAR